MDDLRSNMRPALAATALLTLLCGVVYPMLVTFVAELAFPRQARGSLVERGGAVVGSELIGQPFDDPAYLHGRPSATSPRPYVAFDAATLAGSTGSNLGPTNPAFLQAVAERVVAARAADGDGPLPAELVTASASGLDPHISPAGAERQVARIAAARGVEASKVRETIARRTLGRTFGLLGEPRVNVLLVNLDLDEAFGPPQRPEHGPSGKVVPSPP